MELVTIGLLLGAIHLKPSIDGPPKATPGLYIQTSDDWIGSAYLNCEGRISLMAGRAIGPFQLGLVSGYRSLKYPLYAAVTYRFEGGTRLVLTPKALALGFDFK